METREIIYSEETGDIWIKGTASGKDYVQLERIAKKYSYRFGLFGTSKKHIDQEGKLRQIIEYPFHEASTLIICE